MNLANDLDQSVEALFFGREAELEAFRLRLTGRGGSLPLVNCHAFTGTGKSFLLHRMLKLARVMGLPNAKVQFDAKDGEDSVAIGQHHEILRHIALRLSTPTPRFATAFLAWSLSRELTMNRPDNRLSEDLGGLAATTAGDLISYLITASFGPGGLMVAAAKAGWRILAERVNTDEVKEFHRTPEGKAFVADIRSLPPDRLPAQFNDFFAADIRAAFGALPPGARAVLAFDSWEQFELKYPDRRSRWHEEAQIRDLFMACREWVQFVIVGQRPVTWLEEDRTLRAEEDIVHLRLEGLSREDAIGCLKERRGVTSELWIQAILDASAENSGSASTTHHALSLGMAADTAEEILSRNPGATPDELAVKPNDLEDLVRRFLAVREDQEPVFERLALTPRFGPQEIAVALGKRYDEFSSLTDFTAVERLSFVERLAGDQLSMHGLMRRMLRERMQRHEPEKILAAHRSWQSHYSAQGKDALAFRHALASDPRGALIQWENVLLNIRRLGFGEAHVQLLGWIAEGEDETAYLEPRDAVQFCSCAAETLLECPIGEPASIVSQALALTDRALELAGDAQQKGRAHCLRSRALQILGDLGRAEFQEAQAEAAKADLLLSPEADLETWLGLQILKLKIGRSLARRNADAEAAVRLLEEGERLIELAMKAPEGENLFPLKLEVANIMARLSDLLARDSQLAQRCADLLRDCLTHFTREAHPAKWANCQHLLGITLSHEGEATSSSELLEQGLECFRQGREVCTRTNSPQEWLSTQISLIYTLNVLADLTKEPAFCEEGAEVGRELMEALPRETDPLRWSLVCGGLGKALRIWGDLTGIVEKYREAVHLFEQALEVRRRETMPGYWAIAQVNLGFSLLGWGKVERSLDLLSGARTCFERAMEVYSEEVWTLAFRMCERGLEECAAAIAEIEPKAP